MLVTWAASLAGYMLPGHRWLMQCCKAFSMHCHNMTSIQSLCCFLTLKCNAVFIWLQSQCDSVQISWLLVRVSLTKHRRVNRRQMAITVCHDLDTDHSSTIQLTHRPPVEVSANTVRKIVLAYINTSRTCYKNCMVDCTLECGLLI